MGEIKFRAWLKQEKRMLDKVALTWPGSEMIIQWYDSLDDYYAGALSDCSERDAEVMQYTGLRDRNGVEIYKGDIVKFPVDINKERHGDYSLYEIVSRNGQCFISYLISENGPVLPKGYLYGLLLQHFDYNVPDLFAKSEYYPETKLEVVGNIYENPELLP